MEIYPAIDLKDGKCVRLQKGEFSTVHSVANDPVAVADQYKADGARIIHVVDLDGALHGKGRNSEIVRKIVDAAKPAKIELGGGLRTLNDIDAADKLGVWRFVIGSAATENPEFLESAIAKYGDRIAVGIDAKDGFVKTSGWTKTSTLTDLDFAQTLAKLGVKTIIYTDIEKDGMLSGPSTEKLCEMRKVLPDDITLVASGGLTSLGDIKTLREQNINAAIAGKALYAGKLKLINAIAEARWGEFFQTELIPAIIQHYKTGKVLMLGYMNLESFALTMRTKKVSFFSRKRQKLWVKGETSGNFLKVCEIFTDCDNDTFLLKCEPAGPTCHTGNESCFYTYVED